MPDHTHTIRALYWAKPCRPPPGRESPPRRKGSKAAGLAYERKLGVALAAGPVRVHHGQWFEFCDSGQTRHCQPDFVFRHGEYAIVIEAKLTDTDRAYSQLRGLYFPVLAEALGVPVRGIVVVKHVRWNSAHAHATLASALEAPPSTIPLVHWLGTGPIWGQGGGELR